MGSVIWGLRGVKAGLTPGLVGGPLAGQNWKGPMPNPRKLSLSPEHVALVQRQMTDPAPAPATELHNDADYAEWVDRFQRQNPDPAAPLRLFAYGSLIWKPEIAPVAEEVALARGWHRSFCLRIVRFRGSPDVPGLMMVLDRGGACCGMLFTLPPEEPGPLLDRLFRREFTAKPINNIPRWIRVQTADGPKHALAFVMNRASPHYAGRLSAEAVADVLARACGQWGSGAEYLLNTVTHLEAKGIHDRHLWRLQALVAERIGRS